MHFSKIYLQQNFVPDIVADQFGRKVIGVELTLNEGESLEDAKTTAENYIKEYIEKNTVYHSYPLTENECLPPEPAVLPSIQKEKPLSEMSLEDQICSCTELKVLETYRLIVKRDPALQEIFDYQYELIDTNNYTRPSTTHN